MLHWRCSGGLGGTPDCLDRGTGRVWSRPVGVDFLDGAIGVADNVAGFGPAGYFGADGELPQSGSAGEGLVAVASAVLPAAVVVVGLDISAVHGRDLLAHRSPVGGAGGVWSATGRRHQTSTRTGLVSVAMDLSADSPDGTWRNRCGACHAEHRYVAITVS